MLDNIITKKPFIQEQYIVYAPRIIDIIIVLMSCGVCNI